MREEFLAAHDGFATLAHAQAELDAWVAGYNQQRPHRSLDMATPASRFSTRPGDGTALPLRLPPALAAVPAATQATPSPAAPPAAAQVAADLSAVEFDRIVPARRNMAAGRRQIWLGTAMASQQVTIRLDTTTLHVFRDGELIKTCPSDAVPGAPRPALAALSITRDAAVTVPSMLSGMRRHAW